MLSVSPSPSPSPSLSPSPNARGSYLFPSLGSWILVTTGQGLISMRSLEHRLLAYVQDLEDGGHPKGKERREGETEGGSTALSTRADGTRTRRRALPSTKGKDRPSATPRLYFIPIERPCGGGGCGG